MRQHFGDSRVRLN